MAKEISGYLKIQVMGGQATPAPPIGPALGSKGVNIMDFCKQFNARTESQKGVKFPVVITIYKDKSFDFIVKTPLSSILLKEIANIEKGSKEPNRNKVAKISRAQVQQVAEKKMPDLNTTSIDSAINIVIGTAKSMGIVVED